MEKVKVGQKWSNVTRNQIIEIMSESDDGFWYKVLEQEAQNKLTDHKKNEKHINRLYTLIQ